MVSGADEGKGGGPSSAPLDLATQLRHEKKRTAALAARVQELEAASAADAKMKAKFVICAQQILGVCVAVV